MAGLGFMRSARRNRPKKGSFFCRLHLHVFTHLIKAHFVRLLSGDAYVFGGHNGGISHCTVRGRMDAENGSSYVSKRHWEEKQRSWMQR